MTVKAIPLVITAIFACVASGQTTANPSLDKTFHFTYTDKPQNIQEIVNIIRSIAEVGQVNIDNAARTMTLSGTTNQLALAGWLLPQVDRLTQPPPQPSQSPATLEYQLAGTRDGGVARVFYLSHTETPQAMQEMVNAIRSILELQRAVPYNNLKALVLRGTAEQIAAAEWLINALDKPAGVQPLSSPGGNPAVIAYTFSDVQMDVRFRAPATRVFYLTHTPTPQAMQELVNSVRSLTDLQRVVPVNGPKAIALRGTADQAAMAEWLINALDRPAGTVSPASPNQTPATNQYQLSWSSDVARVFYPHTSTPEELQALVNDVRSTAHIQRATPCHAPGAVALRGTVGQVALAEKLIQERAKL